MAPSSDVVLSVQDLVKHFPLTKGIVVRKQVGAGQAPHGAGAADVRTGAAARR